MNLTFEFINNISVILWTSETEYFPFPILPTEIYHTSFILILYCGMHANFFWPTRQFLSTHFSMMHTRCDNLKN